MVPAKKSLPWKKFSQIFLALYSPPSHSIHTRSKMRHILDLAAQIGVKSTNDLTTELVSKFVAERSKSVCANTVRGDLAYLKAAANYCVEEGWLDRAPRWKRVMPRKSSPRRKTLHRLEEIRWLLARLRARARLGSECGKSSTAHCPLPTADSWEAHRLYALVALVAYTGVRRDEATRMMISDVDLAHGLAHIVERRRLKTEASAAPVPIPPELREILSAWIPRSGPVWLFPGIRRRGPWVGGSLEGRPIGQLHAVADELGIDGMTWQSLRHTFATWCRRRWGLSAIELRDVLRHTTVETQQSYVHADPDPSALVESVRRVSYGKEGAIRAPARNP